MTSGASNRPFAERGLSEAELWQAMDDMAADDRRWDDPKNLKASFWSGDDVVRVAAQAFARHQGDNAIYGASLYPSLKAYESEVVAMGLDMLNAPQGAAGGITTGGTESILMAVKTARDWALANRSVDEAPEILVPETAHPAFEKAAHVTGMRIVRMGSSHGWRADPEAMAEALGPNTVMLVASAPPYPYGVVDPVTDIAALAAERGIWMHVDACIGGFVLPFAAELGEDVPAFDLSVPGVRSISADLHKFGYSSRGASLLLLADGTDQAYQSFSSGAWPAGTYQTLNYGGSRNGGAIASSWAVMRYLGRAGYRERVATILETKKRLMAGIEEIGPFHVLGTPQGAHFSFASDELDMVAVAEGMEARGWILARLERPHGITMLITPRHRDIVEEVLADLAEVAEEVGSGRRTAAGSKAVYVG